MKATPAPAPPRATLTAQDEEQLRADSARRREQIVDAIADLFLLRIIHGPTAIGQAIDQLTSRGSAHRPLGEQGEAILAARVGLEAAREKHGVEVFDLAWQSYCSLGYPHFDKAVSRLG